MVEKFSQILKTRRRRRALVNIRREFEKAGYPLDQFGDSQIEGALTHWTDDIAAVTPNAKAMYRALRRLRGVPACEGSKVEACRAPSREAAKRDEDSYRV